MFAQAPKGWKVRVDRSTSAQDPDAPGAIKFETMGIGLPRHQSAGGGVLEPGQHGERAPTPLKGTFTLLKPSGHTNYYGLVFGGSDLEGPKQGVRLLRGRPERHLPGEAPRRRRRDENVCRNGERRREEAGRQRKSTNALEVRVGADKIDYVVNGQVVHSMPKGSLKTDGDLGHARVNHLLEVQIDNLAVTK